MQFLSFPSWLQGVSSSRQGIKVPNRNFCFLLESCATPGNFASVPEAARRAEGVLGEGGNAAGRAGNGFLVDQGVFFIPIYSRAAQGSTFPVCSAREWCKIPGLALLTSSQCRMLEQITPCKLAEDGKTFSFSCHFPTPHQEKPLI